MIPEEAVNQIVIEFLFWSNEVKGRITDDDLVKFKKYMTETHPSLLAHLKGDDTLNGLKRLLSATIDRENRVR